MDMSRLSRNVLGAVAVSAAVLSLAVVNAAGQATQTTTQVPGTPKVTSAEVKGEVVYLKDDYLVAKMIPNGEYRFFHLKPGRMATIDGVSMPLNKVPLGTVLTATVTTTERPVVERTATTLKGTVWNVPNPNTVILTLENGENRQYEVPKGLMFNVDGQMKEAMELRPGQKITATKIVEAPRVEFSETTTVVGTKKK
jgi:hypothetical protein